MDKNYAMAKFSMESKDILKSKQKGCWHYMKYFFFFSSIIQFLIILGLVLFMLYGDAHGTTERRLKSLESRYKNLTIDHALLMSNYTSLRANFDISQKAVKNCSDNYLRLRLTASTMNRTSFCPRMLPMPSCSVLQSTLDHLNMSCNTEKLKLVNEKMSEYIKFSKELESCTKTMNELASKDRIVGSENAQLQREKKDLESQIKLLRDSCTTIEDKFKFELQNLRNFIETSLKPADPYDSYPAMRCKPLTDAINNRIDHTLGRLRQDVNNFVFENSEIKVAKARITEDLGKCNQDKGIVIAERSSLAAEKTALEKQLREKTDELNKTYAQFMKKIEELENCRKLQMQVRPQGFPQLRPGDIGKRK